VKIALIAVVLVILVIGVVFAIGSMLPIAHTATVRAEYSTPPPDVFAAIADVEGAPRWRDDIYSVIVLDTSPLRWREAGKFGDLTFVREAIEPDRRIVARIADTSQGFGGTWTYLIEPAAGGTTVTITEDGEVYSPLFRFMSRFVFGHYRTLESYAISLGRHFAQDITPVRVPSDRPSPPLRP
jgi:hypothetical protein